MALAVTRDNDHLLIVNSNFDLEYNNGTLMSLDLSRFDSDGVEYDPSAGIVTVDGDISDFCTPGQHQEYCHLDAARWVENDETIRLGAYASDIALTPSGDRAIIPVRGDRAIIVVDVDTTGKDLLSCGEDSNGECDAAHRVGSNSRVSLPIEPFTVDTLDYVYDREGADGQNVRITDTMGFATHMAGGEVSMFALGQSTVALDADGNPEGEETKIRSAELVKVIGGVIEGASGLATNPDPARPDIYVSGRNDPVPHIAVLQARVDESTGSYAVNPWFSQAASISIYDFMASGTDARGVAVSADGKYGFVLVHMPQKTGALLKMDLQSYEVLDTTTVCKEPSVVKTYLDDGGTADPIDDTEYAFVLCFLTGQTFVVDTRYMTTVVRQTGSGPQHIAFDASRDIAFIANFTESTITLMQAVPPFSQLKVRSRSDVDDLKILRIGEPILPRGY